MALLPFPTAAVSSALSPDARLLAVVPPDAQVVAGISVTTHRDQPHNFLFITHNNVMDFQDFFALTGADNSRVVQQIIFLASTDSVGRASEHSLLVSGHFDQARVYRSAADGGGSVARYRDIALMSIQPFAREQGDFNDVRWLAVLDSDVLLFGTIESVRQELDRYLAGNVADASLLRKLARMRKDDQTWCVLSAAAHSNGIRNALSRLDPALARAIENGGSFQFGIHYGKDVEFEYEVSTSSNFDSEVIPNSLETSLASPNMKASVLLPRSGIAGESVTVNGTVKVSRQRYDAWLADVSSHKVILH